MYMYSMHIHMNTIQDKIKFTLELFISCLIALEVSLDPNPYIKELIFILLIYIALKHNLVNKTLNSIQKIPSAFRILPLNSYV